MKRLTTDEYRKILEKPANKKVKNAQPVHVDGIRFASKREAARWAVLKQLEKAGAISELERQVKIPLHGHYGPILTPTGRQMHYIADFRYLDHANGGAEIVVEDAKGHPTEVFQIKRAILAAQGITVRLV